MSDGIRLAGICCSIVGFAVAFIIAPDMPQAWGPFIAIFGALLGISVAVGAIKRRIARARGEEIIGDFTWNEWHAMVSGWGDGVALSKAEKIPKIQEIPEKPRDDDFYAIIAMEAWYYKVGVALGRLTWTLIIGSILIGVFR